MLKALWTLAVGGMVSLCFWQLLDLLFLRLPNATLGVQGPSEQVNYHPWKVNHYPES